MNSTSARNPVFVDTHGSPAIEEEHSEAEREVYDYLKPSEMAPWEAVCGQLNAKLRGWHNYFRYVEQRVRHFLRRRHIQTRSRGTRPFSGKNIFGPLGVYRLERLK